MHISVKAKVIKETPEGTWFTVLAPAESLTDTANKLSHDGILSGGLSLGDGRTITAEQRKKAYATIADISAYTGHMPEELKEIMKYNYIAATGDSYFSLRDCSVTTARQYLDFLLDFALSWGIPLHDPLLERTDDTHAAVYTSLKHRRCVICGRDGEVHHWDAIGMGRDRAVTDDSLMRKICLCREHHGEAHNIGRDGFEKKYHVQGILYNKLLRL